MLGIGKKKDEISPEEEEALIAGYERGVRNAQEEIGIMEQPRSNDLTRLFQYMMSPPKIKGANVDGLILPSFSNTNYPSKISQPFELYTARNQYALVLISLIKPLDDDYPKDGFKDVLSTLLGSLEADNASRRSLNGFMVKEIGTRRSIMQRSEEDTKGKLKNLIRRD